MDAVLWKRLDAEGHDSCRLLQQATGYELQGVAAFWEAGAPCGLTYAVSCDASWQTLRAQVRGHVADQALELEILRTEDGRWRLDGEEQPLLRGLVDVDLGFTPATNLLVLRRLALAVGAQSPAPAAYLAFPERRLMRLEQTYHRLEPDRYHYTASAYHYDDVLTVSPTGFVLDYPGLWRAVSP
jgi:hypothetical protein